MVQMNLKRSLAVTKRVLWRIRNDRRMLGFVFVAPILIMLVFGLAFTGQVKHANFIIVNNDSGSTIPGRSSTISLSSVAIEYLSNDTLFNLQYSSNASEAFTEVAHGQAYGFLVFPRNFTNEIIGKIHSGTFVGNTTAMLWLDRSQPDVTEPMWDGVTNAINEALGSVGAVAPSSVTMNAVYGPHDVVPALSNFYITGIIPFAVFVNATLLSLLSFVSERTLNTLDRVRSTPLTEIEFTLGYALAFGLLGVIQSGVLFTVALAIFHISVSGNILLAFLVLALLAIVSESIGLLMSTLARNETQAVQLIPLLILAAFILSGVFWSVQSFPGWLQPAAYLVPLSYAADSLRSIMIRGWGLSQVWFDFLALTGFLVGFISLGALSMRRRS